MNNFWLVVFTTLFIPALLSQSLEEKEAELNQLKVKEKELRAEVEDLKLTSTISEMQKVGYPKSKESLQILEHSSLVIGFNKSYRMASWSFHQLLPDVIDGGVTRSNDFRPDPIIPEYSSQEADYFLKEMRADSSFKYDGFGFDRGHLAPSADFRWSEKGLSETYYYSNMTPQRPGFNRESWAEVEMLLRKIVANNPKRYFVVTGPVLHDSLQRIERGVNKLVIPDLHYKIIVDLNEEHPKGMAFLMPNSKCELPFFNYIVPIDSVEKITGLDFFPNLSEAIQHQIESKSDYNDWNTDGKGIDVAPLDQDELPKGTYNTIEAKFHEGFEGYVVGKVVSTKVIEKSKATFLNLDQSFPNQIFSLTIWGNARKHFSYLPEEKLDGVYIRVKGQISSDKNGTPTINVTSEKQIELWDPIHQTVIPK